MIYGVIRIILGSYGRAVLDFVVEHQLLIMGLVFTYLVISEMQADPEDRTGWYLDLNLGERLEEIKNK